MNTKCSQYVHRKTQEIVANIDFYNAICRKLLDDNGKIYFPGELKKTLVGCLKGFQLYCPLDEQCVVSDAYLRERVVQIEIGENTRQASISCCPDGKIQMEITVNLTHVLEVTTRTLLKYINAKEIKEVDLKKIHHAHYFHQTIGEFTEKYRQLVHTILDALSSFANVQLPRHNYPFPPASENKHVQSMDLQQKKASFGANTQILSLYIPLKALLHREYTQSGSLFYFAKIYKYFPTLGSVLSIVPAFLEGDSIKLALANLGDEIKIKEIFAISQTSPETILPLEMNEPEYYLMRKGPRPHAESKGFCTNEIVDKIDFANFPSVVNSPMSKFTTFLSTLIWGIARDVRSFLHDTDLASHQFDDVERLYQCVDTFLRDCKIHTIKSKLHLSWRGFLRLQDALIGKNPQWTDTTSILDRLVERGERSVIIQLVGPHKTNVPALKKCFPPKPQKCQQYFGDPNKRLDIARLFGVAAQVAKKAGASGIDINCGCPVSYINCSGGGVALMNSIEMVHQILCEVKNAVGKELPFGVKMRNHKNIREFVKMCLDAGVSWIALHPNTKEQGYQYYSLDNEVLNTCKGIVDDFNRQNSTSVHFIVNGGMLCGEDMQHKLEYVGSTRVSLMIARALRGNPFYLRNALDFVKDGKNLGTFSPLDVSVIGILHLRYLHEYEGILNMPLLTRFTQEYYRMYFSLQNLDKTLRLEQNILNAENLQDLEKVLLQAMLSVQDNFPPGKLTPYRT